MAASPPTRELSLGELIATFTLGQDNAFGQPLESQLRSTLLATWLAEDLGLGVERDTAYWVSQLRFIGCTGHAHEVASLFGDDIETRARTLTYDAADPTAVLREVLRAAHPERRGFARVGVVLSVLAGGKRFSEHNFRTGCEVADLLVERLGVAEPVRAALGFTFERWNGKGEPHGAKGDEIPLPMRIAHLCREVEVAQRVEGGAASVALARRRAGGAYDPELVDAFVAIAATLFERLDKVDPWDEVLALEPDPRHLLRGAALDDALLAAADFIDLKSPFTAGHSRGVAALAADAAEASGLSADDVTAARRASLVHDFGRTAIPNSIWDKPAPLTHAETDRVELHPLLSEQMLRRAPGLAVLNPIAACHHERLDGSGYCKGLSGSQLSPASRIVAAADRYHAMTEDRAHRPALGEKVAAAELRRAVGEGAVDHDAAEAVLAAAGHVARRRRPTYPNGLTAREVEVLRLLTRGLTTKQMAEQLVISAKTADSHIQHIYTKIGVSTRGAAALFAMQHDLVEP
jgi:HD-GYP domain-containing protein (c-di-GMP phosphodiesterase class II)